MNIFEPNSLLLFILFFVPGFVSMKIYDILIPNEARSTASYLFDAVAYSTINFIILLPLLLVMLPLNQHGFVKLVLCASLVLLIIPGGIAWLYVKLLTSKFIRKHAIGLDNRPWDVVFNREQGFWVIVHLKNGSQVAGAFDTKSAASYHPNEEQIYLEKAIKINTDGTVTSVEGTKGVIIMGSEIVLIELFDNKGQSNV